MAFAEATYYMIMAGVAVDIGNMSLTESEETGAENYAKEYYELFTENEKKRSGMTLHGFELAIKRIVLANKYIAFLKDGITVDEEQLRAENKPEDYTCISTEWISVKKTAENAHLAIEKALEKMQSGSSAEETAKFLSSMTEFSTGTRHVNAGNNVEELYLNAVKNADEKGLSGIIEGENVYYVVKVLDKNCNSYYEDRIAHLVDDMKEEALDMLLMAMRNREDLLTEAAKYSVEIEVNSVYDSIESLLTESYGLTPADIAEINSIKKDRDYTIRLMEIVGTL